MLMIICLDRRFLIIMVGASCSVRVADTLQQLGRLVVLPTFGVLMCSMIPGGVSVHPAVDGR